MHKLGYTRTHAYVLTETYIHPNMNIHNQQPMHIRTNKQSFINAFPSVHLRIQSRIRVHNTQSKITTFLSV